MTWPCESCGWVNGGRKCANCKRGYGWAPANVSIIMQPAHPTSRQWSKSYELRNRTPINRTTPVQTFNDGTPWG